MASNPSPHGHMHQHQFALQGTESKPCDAESLVPATLLIKHLPEAIPDVTLSRILANFGASSVRPCSTGRYLTATPFNFQHFFKKNLKVVSLV